MAIVDPRLFELIETLSAAGVDWLVFELMDGIQRGREAEETEQSISLARERVREGFSPLKLEKGADHLLGPDPLQGDEQIDWAIVYITQRLGEVLAGIETAMDNLDAILIGDDSELPRFKSDVGGAVLVFLEGADSREISRRDIGRALSALPKLRAALESWASQVRRPLRS